MITSATEEIPQNCKFKKKQEKTTTTAAALPFKSEQLQLLCM
jgi:hypothetical protein